MSNSAKASPPQQPQRAAQALPMAAQEEVRLRLSQHLQRLVEADPKAAREALEMSQDQAPELYLIAQNQPRSQWPQSLMNSDSMHSLMSRSPSQAKALLEQSDLQSLLELLP